MYCTAPPILCPRFWVQYKAATIGNVIKNRPDLMRKFNENLFREKRGMNRRISHDAEIKK